MTDDTKPLLARITDYLSGGGLFNPEFANHDAVRDLLIECRDALAQQWQPIETCPQSGYFLVQEDTAVRALLRIDGAWHKPGYPAIITPPPFSDVLVGRDALRMLPPGYSLEHRDGCCEEPTHWMPIADASHLAAPRDEDGERI